MDLLSCLIAFTALYLTIHNYVLAQQKIKVDLFDRRYAILKSIKRINSSLNSSKEHPTESEIDQCRIDAQSSSYLLPEKTALLIKKFYIAADHIRIMRIGFDESKEHSENSEEWKEFKTKLEHADLMADMIEHQMSHYLQIEKKGILQNDFFAIFLPIMVFGIIICVFILKTRGVIR